MFEGAVCVKLEKCRDAINHFEKSFGYDRWSHCYITSKSLIAVNSEPIYLTPAQARFVAKWENNQ